MGVLLAILVVLAALGTASAQLSRGVESTAGRWPTWVIGAPRAWRLPPPPPPRATQAEVAELRRLAAGRDAAARELVAYWDTGPPSYRWNELAVAELLREHAYTNVAARHLALLHVALHDAMLVAWETKHAYRRVRPSATDRRLRAAVAVPPSPAYPAEHAVAAGAASAVLAYLHPERAAFFAERAQVAARSRLLAGVDYPSDVRAGLALGRDVAARVIERARGDGFGAPWSGRAPDEPGKWRGSAPILPEAATWRTWTLADAGELRPPPPPAHDSAELAAEVEEIRAFRRTPKSNADALYWEYAAGGARAYQFWNAQVSRALLEHRLDHDAPGAARAYALVHVALHDAAVACWDAKYAYWAIRPVQLDPTVVPLFATPSHPSYPSGHSCFGAAATTVLAHLFPRDADRFHALAAEASESRLWAGIHFRSDLTAGRQLGRAVAERVLRRAGAHWAAGAAGGGSRSTTQTDRAWAPVSGPRLLPGAGAVPGGYGFHARHSPPPHPR